MSKLKESSNGTWNFHFIVGKSGVLVQAWVFGLKEDVAMFPSKIGVDEYFVFWGFQVKENKYTTSLTSNSEWSMIIYTQHFDQVRSRLGHQGLPKKWWPCLWRTARDIQLLVSPSRCAAESSEKTEEEGTLLQRETSPYRQLQEEDNRFCSGFNPSDPEHLDGFIRFAFVVFLTSRVVSTSTMLLELSSLCLFFWRLLYFSI